MRPKSALAVILAAVMTISLCACAKTAEPGPELSDSGGFLTDSTLSTDSGQPSDSPSISDGEQPPDIAASDSAPASDSTPLPDSEPAVSVSPAEEYRAEKSEQLDALYKEISEQKDFPAINITTYMSEPILSKNRYLDAVIDVFNCGAEFELSAAGGVKVRGNSTADQGDEKPYRIKFTEKQNMLGLHNGRKYKSWVLLRSFWNLAPDYMAFNLAKTIFGGEYYSSDCAYVNLYVNGASRGVYLLCEQNQAAKGRVDIAEATGGESPLEIGYLLELDNYADEEEHPFFVLNHDKREFTDMTGQSRRFAAKCYSIRSDTTTREQRDFIAEYLDSVFTILFEAADGNLLMLDGDYRLVSAEGVYGSPREAVEAAIDTRSLANMLILEELAQEYDVGEGSFYMAVDFSAESIYPRLTFLAPWDFNWGYSEDPSGGFYACTFQPPIMDCDRSNVWFVTAMKQEWFADIVKRRWRELSESGAITDTILAVREHTALLANDLGHDAWKVDEAAKICVYVSRRVRFLNSEWGE